MERNPEQIVTWINWRTILFSPSQVLTINFYTQWFVLYMKRIWQTDVIWVAGAVLSKLLWFLDPGNHSPISILIVSMTNLPVRHRHHSQDRHSLLNIFGSFQSPSPPGSKPKAYLFSGPISFHFGCFTLWISLSHFAPSLAPAFPDESSCWKQGRKWGQEAGKAWTAWAQEEQGNIKFPTPSGSVSVDQHGKNTAVPLDRADWTAQ